MGRPTKLTEDIRDKLVQLVETGNYAEVAAEAIGIGKTTFYQWLKRGRKDEEVGRRTRYREFANAIANARAKAQARHVAILSLAAERDWRAAAHYLERTDPNRWGNRGTMKLEGEVGAKHSGTVEVTSDDTLAAAIGGDPEAAGLFARLVQRAASRASASGSVGVVDQPGGTGGEATAPVAAGESPDGAVLGGDAGDSAGRAAPAGDGAAAAR